jgi:hypothetical protein
VAEVSMPGRLRPLLDVLRRAYPKGVPQDDYAALLDFLQWFMSERSLATIVAAVIDGDPAAVASESAVLAALPADGLKGTDNAVWRVRHRLEASGWDEVARGFDAKDVHDRISPVPDQPDYMLDSLAILRRAYPDGIPGAEYRPLLAALHKEMSFRNVGALVGAFAGRHYVAVMNEANGASSVSRSDRAPHRDIDRVWLKLLGHGWTPEFPLPPCEQPGFADQAITALQRAYARGLSADDYQPLLAALGHDVDDGAGPAYDAIAYIVSEAFPDRDPVTIWHDALALHDSREDGKASSDIERCRRHLLAHGFPSPGGPGGIIETPDDQPAS